MLVRMRARLRTRLVAAEAAMSAAAAGDGRRAGRVSVTLLDVN